MTALLVSLTASFGQEDLNYKVVDAENLPDGAGKVGGALHLTLIADPSTLVPNEAVETASLAIISQLHASLLEPNLFTGRPEPAVAEAYGLSEDGKTLTFTLRGGLKWSDGTPVTVDDVIATFEEIFSNPKAPLRSVFPKRDDGTVAITITKIDDSRVQFKLDDDKNFSAFVEAIGMSAFITKKGASDESVGLGPFRLKNLVSGQLVEFERNPYYWKKDSQNILPYLDGMRFLLAPLKGEDVALQNFRAGETHMLEPRPQDIAVIRGKVEAAQLEILRGSFASQLTERGTGTLFFNWDAPNKALAAVFSTKEFRQAVSLATDRKTIRDVVWFGLAVPAWSYVDIDSTFFIGRETRPNPPSDFPEISFQEGCFEDFFTDANGNRVAEPGVDGGCLAEAAGKLDQLGLVDTDGDGVRNITDAFLEGRLSPEELSGLGPEDERELEFELITNRGNTQREAMIAIIANDLAKIGIRVFTNPIEFTALVSRIIREDAQGRPVPGNYEAVLVGLEQSFDPLFAANAFRCDGRLHFWHVNCQQDPTETEVEMDSLYDRASAGEDKIGAFDEAQKLVAEDQWLIQIVAPNVLFARVENLCVQGLASINNFLEGPGVFTDIIFFNHDFNHDDNPC